MMIQCPNCGRHNDEQAKVCEVCGCPVKLRPVRVTLGTPDWEP